MHREPFVVSRKLLEELKAGNRPVVAVGTTSVRTLESLYYVGVSCLETGKPTDVDQWAPYTREYPYSTEEALGAILDWMDRSGEDRLTVGTRIIIVPGFRFRLVEKLVTNFHQPESGRFLLPSLRRMPLKPAKTALFPFSWGWRMQVPSRSLWRF